MKKNKKIAIFLAVLMVISGIVGIGLSIESEGIGLFQMYTEDSNILNLLTSIIYLFYLLNWIPQTDKNARLVKNLRYVATSCVTLTFLVVLFILAPMTGGINGFKFMFFSGSMLFNHFLTPILAVISFVFYEKEPALTNKSIWYALVPTVIYGTITILLNAVGVMEGPYPFLRVRDQSIIMSIIWIIIVYALNYVIARLILTLNRKESK